MIGRERFMTEDRVDALTELIEAVEALGREHAIRDNTPAEERVLDALMKVRICGADVAILMPIVTTV